MATSVSAFMGGGLRALFKIDVNQDFFRLQPEEEKEFGQTLIAAFENLHDRFGVKVLGTLDDDLLAVGQTFEARCVSYILADVPSLDAVVEVTNLMRTRFKGNKIARYVRIEARVGRPLFFGTH